MRGIPPVYTTDCKQPYMRLFFIVWGGIFGAKGAYTIRLSSPAPVSQGGYQLHMKRYAHAVTLIVVTCTAALCMVVLTACASDSDAAAPQESPTQEDAAVPSAQPVPESPAPEAHTLILTEYQSEESEAFLWDCLSKYSPSDAITAAVLAMFWRESAYRSDAVARWHTSSRYLGYDLCEEFTKTVDEGLADGSSRDYFIEKTHYATGGYGLGQWSAWHYLEDYYDFAREWGTSIGDAEMQCAFVIQHLQSMDEVWQKLIDAGEDPVDTGFVIGRFYDGTSRGEGYIAQISGELYEKYTQSTGKAA